MQALFDRFTITMTLAQAESAGHSGQCDKDVEALASMPAIRRQLKKLNPEDVRAELKSTGGWSEAGELANHEENLLRVVWLAACQIMEENRERVKRSEAIRAARMAKITKSIADHREGRA